MYRVGGTSIVRVLEMLMLQYDYTANVCCVFTHKYLLLLKYWNTFSCTNTRSMNKLNAFCDQIQWKWYRHSHVLCYGLENIINSVWWASHGFIVWPSIITRLLLRFIMGLIIVTIWQRLRGIHDSIPIRKTVWF